MATHILFSTAVS